MVFMPAEMAKCNDDVLHAVFVEISSNLKAMVAEVVSDVTDFPSACAQLDCGSGTTMNEGVMATVVDATCVKFGRRFMLRAIVECDFNKGFLTVTVMAGEPTYMMRIGWKDTEITVEVKRRLVSPSSGMIGTMDDVEKMIRLAIRAWEL